jgi:hypothetical protein
MLDSLVAHRFVNQFGQCVGRFGRCVRYECLSPEVPSIKEATDILADAKRELMRLNAKWQIWEELFGKSPAQLDLLNERAVTFFGTVWDILMDEVMLGICRLTDPARGTRPTISIERLALRLERVPRNEARDETRHRLRKARRLSEPFRVIRNRRLAHRDHQTALSPQSDPLPGVSRAMIGEALDALGDFLSDFDGKYLGGPTSGYNRSMWIEGGPAEVIDALEKSVRYEALVKQGVISGD